MHRCAASLRGTASSLGPVDTTYSAPSRRSVLPVNTFCSFEKALHGGIIDGDTYGTLVARARKAPEVAPVDSIRYAAELES